MSTEQRLLDPVGGEVSIWELDGLVLFMCLAVTLHALQCGKWRLLITGMTLGYVVETLSLRLGGTHCHASGLVNFSDCSSANSVFYYVPWVYCGISCGRRLVGEKSFAFPFVCGLLFFLMCGIYECQGPTLRWWLWPDEEGVVKPGSALRQFGDLELDTRGMVATLHAHESLQDRVFGMPIMAPYFHTAFGWGIAAAFQVVGFDGTIFHHLLPVLLGPLLAMLWDPPIRILENALGAERTVVAVGVMVTSYLAALIVGPALKINVSRDYLLMLAPAANTFFFLYQAIIGRGADIIPGELKLLVVVIAVLAVVSYGRATGLLCCNSQNRAPQQKKIC